MPLNTSLTVLCYKHSNQAQQDQPVLCSCLVKGSSKGGGQTSSSELSYLCPKIRLTYLCVLKDARTTCQNALMSEHTVCILNFLGPLCVAVDGCHDHRTIGIPICRLCRQESAVVDDWSSTWPSLYWSTYLPLSPPIRSMSCFLVLPWRSKKSALNSGLLKSLEKDTGTIHNPGSLPSHIFIKKYG